MAARKKTKPPEQLVVHENERYRVVREEYPEAGSVSERVEWKPGTPEHDSELRAARLRELHAHFQTAEPGSVFEEAVLLLVAHSQGTLGG